MEMINGMSVIYLHNISECSFAWNHSKTISLQKYAPGTTFPFFYLVTTPCLEKQSLLIWLPAIKKKGRDKTPYTQSCSRTLVRRRTLTRKGICAKVVAINVFSQFELWRLLNRGGAGLVDVSSGPPKVRCCRVGGRQAAPRRQQVGGGGVGGGGGGPVSSTPRDGMFTSPCSIAAPIDIPTLKGVCRQRIGSLLYNLRPAHLGLFRWPLTGSSLPARSALPW